MPSDADDILDSIKPKTTKGKLELWLEKHPDEAKTFWDVMRRGYGSGDHKFAIVFRAFIARHPSVPSIKEQGAKVFVDARL